MFRNVCRCGCVCLCLFGMALWTKYAWHGHIDRNVASPLMNSMLIRNEHMPSVVYTCFIGIIISTIYNDEESLWVYDHHGRGLELRGVRPSRQRLQ